MNQFDVITVGPGVWFLIHTMAYHAKSYQQKQVFEGLIHHLMIHFGCEECRTHIQEFIKVLPIKKNYKNLFYWSWLLHNSVNRKLHKVEMDYQMALLRYEHLVCHNCGTKDDSTLSPLSPIITPIDVSTHNNDFINLIS